MNLIKFGLKYFIILLSTQAWASSSSDDDRHSSSHHDSSRHCPAGYVAFQVDDDYDDDEKKDKGEPRRYQAEPSYFGSSGYVSTDYTSNRRYEHNINSDSNTCEDCCRYMCSCDSKAKLYICIFGLITAAYVIPNILCEYYHHNPCWIGW